MRESIEWTRSMAKECSSGLVETDMKEVMFQMKEMGSVK